MTDYNDYISQQGPKTYLRRQSIVQAKPETSLLRHTRHRQTQLKKQKYTELQNINATEPERQNYN